MSFEQGFILKVAQHPEIMTSFWNVGESIRSILEDSPILPCFFRLSLLMLCVCCKVRDFHMSRCVRITKQKQQQRSCILVKTRTQHKKRVPRAAEAISQVLFSFFIGIK